MLSRRAIYHEKLKEIEEKTEKFNDREEQYKARLEIEIGKFEEKQRELEEKLAADREDKDEEEEVEVEEKEKEKFDQKGFDEKFNEEIEPVIIPPEPKMEVDADFELDYE